MSSSIENTPEEGKEGTNVNMEKEETDQKTSKVEEKNAPKEGSKTEKEFWCSWCVKKSKHELLVHSYVRRNLYRCCNCYNQVIHCVLCKKGMSFVVFRLNTKEWQRNSLPLRINYVLCATRHFLIGNPNYLLRRKETARGV